MAEIQPVTDQLSCVHENNEALLESKSVVAAMTTKCELANDDRVGSSSVEVSRNVEVDTQNEETEAVPQNASYTSVVAG